MSDEVKEVKAEPVQLPPQHYIKLTRGCNGWIGIEVSSPNTAWVEREFARLDKAYADRRSMMKKTDGVWKPKSPQEIARIKAIRARIDAKKAAANMSEDEISLEEALMEE